MHRENTGVDCSGGGSSQSIFFVTFSWPCSTSCIIVELIPCTMHVSLDSFSVRGMHGRLLYVFYGDKRRSKFLWKGWEYIYKRNKEKDSKLILCMSKEMLFHSVYCYTLNWFILRCSIVMIFFLFYFVCLSVCMYVCFIFFFSLSPYPPVINCNFNV